MSKFIFKTKMLGAMAGSLGRVARANMNASTNMSATFRVAKETPAWAASRATKMTYDTGLSTRHVFVESPYRRTEMQQRKKKMDENLANLRLINQQRPQFNRRYRVPFVPSDYNPQKKSLRHCASVEEVLRYTTEPTKLATELVNMSRKLNIEEKKTENILSRYRHLEANYRATNNEIKYWHRMDRWRY